MEVNGVTIVERKTSNVDRTKVGEVNGVPIYESQDEGGGNTTIAKDFDQFLQLLVTQLENQDPLSPLDTTEFTNQLTNFAQVEQGINMNKKMETLIGLQDSNRLTTGVQYIGKLAEAKGDVVTLEDGFGQIGYELDVDSARTVITFLNQNGTPVFSTEGSTSAGPHVYRWDGLDEVGNQLPDGPYDVLVTALDADDAVQTSTVTSFGKVTGVEIVNGEVSLVMGALSVSLDDVRSITLPPEPGTAETTEES